MVPLRMQWGEVGMVGVGRRKTCLRILTWTSRGSSEETENGTISRGLNSTPLQLSALHSPGKGISGCSRTMELRFCWRGSCKRINESEVDMRRERSRTNNVELEKGKLTSIELLLFAAGFQGWGTKD